MIYMIIKRIDGIHVNADNEDCQELCLNVMTSGNFLRQFDKF